MDDVYEPRELQQVASLTKLATNPPVTHREHFDELAREMQRYSDAGEMDSFWRRTGRCPGTSSSSPGIGACWTTWPGCATRPGCSARALAHEGGLRHAADQHRDLLNAVLGGDVLRTEQLMRDHVAYTRQGLGPHQPTG